MTTGRSEEFRHDAVRIALTSGLTRRQVSSDLGVGLSPLNKWIKNHGDRRAGRIRLMPTFCVRMSVYVARTVFLRRKGRC